MNRSQRKSWRLNTKLKLAQLLKKVFSYLDRNHREEIYFLQLLMGVPIYCSREKIGGGGVEDRDAGCMFEVANSMFKVA